MLRHNFWHGEIIYFNTLWVGWDPHTHFHPPQPFCHVKTIMSQHDSNYWTTYIILIVSKYLLDSTILFTQYIQIPIHPLNTIYQIIYFNMQPTHLCFFGHFYTCELIIYTYKPPIYTRQIKLWKKGVTSTVSSKVMRVTLVNLN